MEKKVSIVGGDLRIVNLAKMMYEDGFEVYTYGLENAEELANFKEIKQVINFEDVFQKSDTVISSIPLSKYGENVNAPYSKLPIKIDDVYNNIIGKKFISGKLDCKFKNHPKIQCYDILDIEEYAILNAIATAEGAIQVAMEEYSKTISGSNILVMGFGRIGKVIAKMLQGIGAKVFCEARKSEDLAYIKAYGYEPVDLKNLNEHLNKFDIIINNIPVQVLDKPKLDLVKKDVLIIDLASKPGGVDFDYAKKQNIKTIWALALPGKVAPVSAAEYIKETIYHIIMN